MEYLGISFTVKNRPALDGGYIPFAAWREAYLAEADHPVRIAVERQDGQTAVFETKLRGNTCSAASLPDV